MKKSITKFLCLAFAFVTLMCGMTTNVEAASYKSDSRRWTFDCGSKMKLKAYFNSSTLKFVKFDKPTWPKKGNMVDYDFRTLASSSKYVGECCVIVTDEDGYSEKLTISAEWDDDEDEVDWDYAWD